MRRVTHLLARQLPTTATAARVTAPRAFLSSEPDVQLAVAEDLPDTVLSVNPLGDANEDLGKFFEIPDDAFASSFPRGVDAGIDVLFQRLDNCKRLMVRPPALHVIDCLKAADAMEPASPNLLVLSSEGWQQTHRGVGKTATLLHVVHWARSQGWLVLHVPSARLVTEGGYWVLPSEDTAGDFDQPQVATDILDAFVAAHGDVLGGLRLRTAEAKRVVASRHMAAATSPGGELYKGGKFGKLSREDAAVAAAEVESAAALAGEGASLRDLVGCGLVSKEAGSDPTKRLVGAQLAERFGSQALLMLRREMACLEEVPCLVAVDDYNLLFESTNHFYDGKRLPSERLTVCQALRDLCPDGTSQVSASAHGGDGGGGGGNGGWLKRGVVVGCETSKSPKDPHGLDYYAGAGAALKGGKAPDGVVCVPVGPLSSPEFESLCDFMAASKVLNADSAGLRGALKMQSQGNPKVLVRRIMLT